MLFTNNFITEAQKNLRFHARNVDFSPKCSFFTKLTLGNTATMHRSVTSQIFLHSN